MGLLKHLTHRRNPMTDFDLLAQVAYDKLNPDGKKPGKRQDSDAAAWARADNFVQFLTEKDVTGFNSYAQAAFFRYQGTRRV
jgi:hypothetical protein